MDKKQIAARLRKILDRVDIESDGLINRQRSSKHDDDIDVLLEHVSLLVTDLQFNLAATLNELFDVRCLLEE